MNIDKTKLSIQEQAALELYQQNEHLIQVADDIAAILQDMSSNDTDKKELKAITNLGAVLLDVRDKLGELNDKEAAEMPDFSTPIVSALEKLQKAFNIPAPVVNVDVPKIDAPQVTVDVPKLDLKGIENLLKKDIPQAFKDAIQSIPQVELPEPVDRWDEVLTWLESIDTASRMKPQMPNTMNVISNSLTNTELRASAVPTSDTVAQDILKQIEFNTDALNQLAIVVKTLQQATVNPPYIDKSANAIRNQVQSGTVTTVTTVTNLTNLTNFGTQAADVTYRINSLIVTGKQIGRAHV